MCVSDLDGRLGREDVEHARIGGLPLDGEPRSGAFHLGERHQVVSPSYNRSPGGVGFRIQG